MAIHDIRRLRGRAGTILAMGLCLLASLGSIWAASASSAGKRALVPFSVSPFPYRGEIPGQGKPFLDVDKNGRRGHTSPRDGLLWEDETYSDKRVLLYIPPSFDASKPAVLVLFFHGNQAMLERDVEKRQGVLRQLAQSRLNAVFVAPQFAVNALDSSAGTFWQPGTLTRFLDEAASRLVGLDGGKTPKDVFAGMPVVIVAYSGGYLPAAYSLTVGGLGQRLAGVVLMDAIYGEIDRFADGIEHKSAKSFVFSAFSESSRAANGQLQSMLQQRGVATQSGALSKLSPGNIVFMSAGGNLVHNDFLTRAWTHDPLRFVFARIANFYPVTGASTDQPAAVADSGDVSPPADVAPASPTETQAAVPPAAEPPPLPPQRPDSAPKEETAAADPAPDPAVGSLADPPAPVPEKPRNLGAIVPSANPPGFAAIPLAPPMLGMASIELGTAASEQEALVAAAHLQAECAGVIGNHKIKPVPKDGGKGFSIRIGPLSQMDYGFLCGRMTHGNCLCRPAAEPKSAL